MNRIAFLLLFGLVFQLRLFAQATESPRELYDRALVKAQTGELDSAIMLLDRSIALKDNEYVAWYNRAIVKIMMGRYDDALPDLEQTIVLNPGYKKAYLNRGTVKKHLTDYAGALNDFTLAMLVDSTYGEAYYDRGIVYQMFGKNDEACEDFNKAYKLGFKNAEPKVGECNNHSFDKIKTILVLNRTAENYKYGFSTEAPVLTGTGPEGGIANEKAYLDLLRDAKGNPIRYVHGGSCCAYASKNAPKGLAMLDKYQITYTDDQGEIKTALVYLSPYDYSEPLILKGFGTVHYNK